ncbi:MAG: hypothetical protein LC790_08855 [Actinobacteria bacterium]|nr:hypothetical protein [Actinomycetota bacterium]
MLEASEEGDSPDNTPRGTNVAWAVWNAWRVDPPLFARVVRAANHAVEHAFDERVRCSIEMAVKGDVEHFTSADDMLEHATPQALRSFASITVTVTASECKAGLVVARKPTTHLPWDDLNEAVQEEEQDQVPGAVLVVNASGGARKQAESVRDDIAAAFDRGGFARTKSRGYGGRNQAREALIRRISTRRRQVASTLGVALVVASAIVVGVLAIAGVAITQSLAFAVGVGPAILGALSGAGLLSRLPNLVFPAVEIAQTTPGRRITRLSLRIVPLVAAPLSGALVKSLLDAP